MGRLSTHVLDVRAGKPAAGMQLDFSVLESGAWRNLKTVHTNRDGRTDDPLMADEAMRAGEFKLVFHVAAYFRGEGVELPAPPLFDRVPIRFGIADAAASYHVPLLCTPWSYSTYRGS
jgi:5-hydroxyisourate hydrolase